MKFKLYLNTLRYLKANQIWQRLKFNLFKPKPDTRPSPKLRSVSGPWQQPASRSISLISQDRFCFLNIEHNVSDSADWNQISSKKLWLYNLHYFDDLNAENSTNRTNWHRSLMKRWIIDNPPGFGVGWEPYPLSLRIVNWIKWSLSGNTLDKNMQKSLAIQIRFLKMRVEYHLLGNHLISNAKALIFGGYFFDGDEPDSWLECGMSILTREIPEQILMDGGHFEKSTMYSALVLEDMLDLINISKCFKDRVKGNQKKQLEIWSKRSCDLKNWLRVMCHPDGEISFFNDAAFNVAPNLAKLEAYATNLLEKSENLKNKSSLIHLKNSGYIRLTFGSAVALLDVASIGPDYLPAHAHADTLSFEFSLRNQRVLVNSGTSCYENSSERAWQRGTAAHNTVIIDGQDSSEVWSSFRVAKRAYPIKLSVQESICPTNIKVFCGHDGYERLRGRPIHYRTWNMCIDELNIIDKVDGKFNCAYARFHFHPSILLEIKPDKTGGIAKLLDGSIIKLEVKQGLAYLEPSTWHSQFGHSQENICLVIKLIDNSSVLNLQWNQ